MSTEPAPKNPTPPDMRLTATVAIEASIFTLLFIVGILLVIDIVKQSERVTVCAPVASAPLN